MPVRTIAVVIVCLLSLSACNGKQDLASNPKYQAILQQLKEDWRANQPHLVVQGWKHELATAQAQLELSNASSPNSQKTMVSGELGMPVSLKDKISSLKHKLAYAPRHCSADIKGHRASLKSKQDGVRKLLEAKGIDTSFPSRSLIRKFPALRDVHEQMQWDYGMLDGKNGCGAWWQALHRRMSLDAITHLKIMAKRKVQKASGQ